MEEKKSNNFASIDRNANDEKEGPPPFSSVEMRKLLAYSCSTAFYDFYAHG